MVVSFFFPSVWFFFPRARAVPFVARVEDERLHKNFLCAEYIGATSAAADEAEKWKGGARQYLTDLITKVSERNEQGWAGLPPYNNCTRHSAGLTSEKET